MDLRTSNVIPLTKIAATVLIKETDRYPGLMFCPDVHDDCKANLYTTMCSAWMALQHTQSRNTRSSSGFEIDPRTLELYR